MVKFLFRVCKRKIKTCNNRSLFHYRTNNMYVEENLLKIVSGFIHVLQYVHTYLILHICTVLIHNGTLYNVTITKRYVSKWHDTQRYVTKRYVTKRYISKRYDEKIPYKMVLYKAEQRLKRYMVQNGTLPNGAVTKQYML